MNKPNACFWSIYLIFVHMVFSCNPPQKEVPFENRLQEFIQCGEESAAYFPIMPHYEGMELPIPEFISKSQALEDIEVFEHLVRSSYSGYEYWQKLGVDFGLYFSQLRDSVNNQDSMAIQTFEREWVKILDLLSDGHIGLQGRNYHGAYKHKSVYFCEIVVEEAGTGSYKVIDSQCSRVKPGDHFTQQDAGQYLFPTLSPTGKKHYLIGMYSIRPMPTQELSFNDRPIKIQFYENRLGFVKNKPEGPFSMKKEGPISEVNVTSFANEIYPQMKAFMESGNQLKEEKFVIVNVMNNGGGSSLFPQTFIRNLNGSLNWETYWGELTTASIVEYYAGYSLESRAAQSPGFRQMIQKNRSLTKVYQISPKRKWVCSRNDQLPSTGEEFQGELIVLTNRYVLSAGEAFVGASACVKNRIIAGENTGGSGMFSSACSYYLPNSKFIAKLPRHFILIPYFEECRGFLPDYWINSAEPVKEIYKWLHNKESYRFSYPNNYDQFIAAQLICSDLIFPGDMNIQVPNADIQTGTARFSGSWFGIAEGVLNTAIVVEEVLSNSEAEVIYVWGRAPQWGIQEAGWERFRARWWNNKLLMGDPAKELTITLSIRDEGKMEMIYKRPGIHSEVVLTKVH